MLHRSKSEKGKQTEPKVNRRKEMTIVAEI